MYVLMTQIYGQRGYLLKLDALFYISQEFEINFLNFVFGTPQINIYFNNRLSTILHA